MLVENLTDCIEILTMGIVLGFMLAGVLSLLGYGIYKAFKLFNL